MKKLELREMWLKKKHEGDMSKLEPKSWDLAASPLFTSPQSLPWSRSHRTHLCETENHTSNESSKASVFGENNINLQIKNKQRM